MGRGLARISYDDWLENATDVWVARLGAPVKLLHAESYATAYKKVAAQSNTYAYVELRPHLISIGNNGKLKPGSDYGSTPAEVAQTFADDFPRLMGPPDAGKPKHLLLYAHGGLVSAEAAVQRVAEYRPALLAKGGGAMDEADRAAQEKDFNLAECLYRARVQALMAPALLAKGRCHYCDESAPAPLLFCLEDCAQDFRSEDEQLKRMGCQIDR